VCLSQLLFKKTHLHVGFEVPQKLFLLITSGNHCKISGRRQLTLQGL